MIGRLNHVAIAVPDLEAAAAQYRGALGAEVGPPQDEPDHGVTVIFVTLPTPRSSSCIPSARPRPSPPSSRRTRRAASTTSATRSRTSSPRATS